MNREHKIFLGWGTVFKRDIHLNEQRKECWIGSGAKRIYIQRIEESLWSGGEGNEDSKCALFIPSAHA